MLCVLGIAWMMDMAGRLAKDYAHNKKQFVIVVGMMYVANIGLHYVVPTTIKIV